MKQTARPRKEKVKNFQGKLKTKLVLSLATSGMGLGVFVTGIVSGILKSDIALMYGVGFAGIFLVGCGIGIATADSSEEKSNRKQIDFSKEEFEKYSADHDYIEQNFGK